MTPTSRRARGTPNKPALEKIRANRDRFEKMLLEKALAGDVVAIKSCLELLAQQDKAAPAH